MPTSQPSSLRLTFAHLAPEIGSIADSLGIGSILEPLG